MEKSETKEAGRCEEAQADQDDARQQASGIRQAQESQVMFFCDAYADRPVGQRAKLTEEIRRLKMLLWADGGSDPELKMQITAMEAALHALDRSER